jgi:hypothetical protein
LRRSIRQENQLKNPPRRRLLRERLRLVVLRRPPLVLRAPRRALLARLRRLRFDSPFSSIAAERFALLPRAMEFLPDFSRKTTAGCTV